MNSLQLKTIYADVVLDISMRIETVRPRLGGPGTNQGVDRNTDYRHMDVDPPTALQQTEGQGQLRPMEVCTAIQIEDLAQLLWVDGIRFHKESQNRIHDLDTMLGEPELVTLLSQLDDQKRSRFFNYLIDNSQLALHRLLDTNRGELASILNQKYASKLFEERELTWFEAGIVYWHALRQKLAESRLQNDDPFSYLEEE